MYPDCWGIHFGELFDVRNDMEKGEYDSNNGKSTTLHASFYHEYFYHEKNSFCKIIQSPLLAIVT